MSDREIQSFFQDPDASSAVVLAAAQIAAPMVRGTSLTMAETMLGGGLRVTYFIVDGSPSMLVVAALLRDGFNHDFVPAVRAAREDDISALRVGGVVFSSGSPKPIWVGADGSHFHPFDKLPELTVADYDPRRGYGTALHRAIVEGSAQAFKYAGELQTQTGMDVDVDIVILSDGANNAEPEDPTEARLVITGRDKTRVRYVFFYFETDWGLSVTRPSSNELSELEKYATQDLGIDGEQVVAFARGVNETAEDQAKRFRALMQVMSRVSAARNTSAVVAFGTVLDDDELV
jgi:hypothetical protein